MSEAEDSRDQDREALVKDLTDELKRRAGNMVIHAIGESFKDGHGLVLNIMGIDAKSILLDAIIDTCNRLKQEDTDGNAG